MKIEKMLDQALGTLYDISMPDCYDWKGCHRKKKDSDCPSCQARRTLKKIVASVSVSSDGYAFRDMGFAFKRRKDAVNFATILSGVLGLEFVRKGKTK